MNKLSTISSNCRECVFYRKSCVLGHKRPWNAMACDDFRPYCLVCNCPGEFCNTCRIFASRRMRPLEMDMKPVCPQESPMQFDCVWQPPQMAQ